MENKQNLITKEQLEKILARDAWSITDIMYAFNYKDRKKATAIFKLARDRGGGRLSFDDRRVWKRAVYKVAEDETIYQELHQKQINAKNEEMVL